MQQCILEGHKDQEFAGHGEYEGQRFLVCVRCGRTLPRQRAQYEEELAHQRAVTYLDPYGIDDRRGR